MIAALGMALCVLLVLYAEVSITERGNIYTDSWTIPKNSVGLLLGTTSSVNGQENLYFRHRIDAAAKLYKEARVDCLIVSWDNSTQSYNEARDMQSALMKAWVPPERIFLDYAGFRTLDSVVRAKEVFGQKRFTIISQSFHDARALKIASHFWIDAIAYAAEDVPLSLGLKTMIRELGSRAALYFDLYIADTSPKFLWKPVRIPTDPTERPIPENICFPR